MQDRYRVAAIAPVGTEIGNIRGNHWIPGVQFAHADQAQVRKVRITVPVSPGEFRNARQVIGKTERELNQPCAHEIENQDGIREMENRFGQYGLARKQWFRHPARQLNGPAVVSIGRITERDQEPCISNRFHVSEKPLRIER
jgi:hypothetical protein